MSEANQPFQRPPTAQQAALTEIRKAIVSGRLEPGAPIRQDALAKQFGVSRVPVREALKVLEGEGRVIYQPHKGYLVAKLDFDEVKELYLIRRLLEDEALAAGVPELTDEQVDQLEHLAAEMEVLDGDMTDVFAALNRQFHFIFFEAGGLSRLVNFIRILWDSSDAYRSVTFTSEEQHRTIHHEHRLLVDGARRRDTQQVIDVFSQHRQSALDFLSGVLTMTDDHDADAADPDASSPDQGRGPTSEA